ncbi:MAG TPA: hypothetical protein PLY09_07630 [Methanothrix sp.]|nr:hypothetical protein [Methanothrix sp.]
MFIIIMNISHHFSNSYNIFIAAHQSARYLCIKYQADGIEFKCQNAKEEQICLIKRSVIQRKYIDLIRFYDYLYAGKVDKNIGGLINECSRSKEGGRDN